MAMAPFPHGQTVIRLRRPLFIDPYNPDTPTLGPWSDADETPISGAYVSSLGSNAIPDPSRAQVTTTKYLYCAPDADVTVGDRILTDGPLAGLYAVNEMPAADVNPFTGWQPVREVPLQEVRG